MGLGSWPGGLPKKDGATALSGAGSVDTATTWPSKTSRTKNLIIEYQRRALHAGQCGVEVEGGRVPTHDWMLNLQILTSGGFR